jgi:CubicO group peptidase (beta-lactamase class C family)
MLAALLLAVVAPSFPIAAQQPPSTSAAPSVFPGHDWAFVSYPESVGFSGARLKDLSDYLKALDTNGLMVIVGGRVLYRWGDVKQLSYVASVRKSILAILYGKYVANGTIRLDRTLRDLGMSDVGGLLPIEREATVEDLLTARSGVYHPASYGGDDFQYAPPRGSQKPGTYFLYNNWDFDAAGFVFEKLTGKNIYDVLENDLARPIGMQDFVRSAQHKEGDLSKSIYSAYPIWLSTRDMARIGYLMLREGDWAGRQVVPREWARKIVSVVTPVQQMNPPQYRQGRLGYGYLWWVWDDPQAVGPYRGAYTAAGMFGQYITVLPALDIVIAHKVIPAYAPERRVTLSQYRGILDRLIAAKIH